MIWKDFKFEDNSLSYDELSSHTFETVCSTSSCDVSINRPLIEKTNNFFPTPFSVACTRIRSILRSSNLPESSFKRYETTTDLTAKTCVYSSTAATNVPSRSRKTVTFGQIEIHEHYLTLGDHPDCSCGFPIQLDWERVTSSVQHVDDYELTRKPRQKLNCLVVDSYDRRAIVSKRLGMSNKEMNATLKDIKQSKHQRAITKKLAPLHFAEDVLESTVRKFKRALRKWGENGDFYLYFSIVNLLSPESNFYINCHIALTFLIPRWSFIYFFVSWWTLFKDFEWHQDSLIYWKNILPVR